MLVLPQFQGAVLFIVTLSDHIVPKGSHEGAGEQSGCQLPSAPLSCGRGGTV